MRFLRRIAGFLGFVRENGHELNEEDQGQQRNNNNIDDNRPNFQETGSSRKGFGVQVQVAVERPQLGPVIVPCAPGDGGVQGLRWHAKRLRIDEDGDVADEFLDQVLPQPSAMEEEQHRPLPKFEVRYSTRQAKVKNQVLTPDGKIQQCVEYQGRLLWV